MRRLVETYVSLGVVRFETHGCLDVPGMQTTDISLGYYPSILSGLILKTTFSGLGRCGACCEDYRCGFELG